MGTNERMPPDHDRRIRKYLIFRLLIILTGVGLVGFYRLSLGQALGNDTFRFLYVLLGAYLLLGVTLFALYPRLRRRGRSMRWQVVLDFVIQTLLIWGTGGVLSIFSPLLFVTLVAATSVISARGSFILASIVTLFLTVTTLALAFDISPRFLGAPAPMTWLAGGEKSLFVVSYLLGSIFALYTVSSLGSRFSHGLQSMQGIHSEILENMAEGLIAVSQNGNVVQINREARKLLGLPEADFKPGSLTLADVFPHPRLGELRDALQHGKRRRLSATISTSDGITRPVEVKISAVNGDLPQPRFRIALIADLTLKHEVEAAERRIQKLEDLHVMAMGIAHEIRNPLASIRGCVQEIVRLQADNPDVARYASIVCRESDRLDGILEEFMRYARSGPVDLKPLDLVDALGEAVTLLQNRGDLGGRTIEWEQPEDHPRIFGDRNCLIQVFLNLGLNAIEASSTQEGRIVFRMRRKVFTEFRDGERGQDLVPGVQVEVSDNGTGMCMTNCKGLFTPFYTTKSSGSGLGLCIVDRVVREHMGVVSFSSEEGRGTSFRVWFPAIRAETNEDEEMWEDTGGGRVCCSSGSGERSCRETQTEQ